MHVFEMQEGERHTHTHTYIHTRIIMHLYNLYNYIVFM